MRQSNRRTATFVKQVKTAGSYRDGAGLMLKVEESGSKHWVLRVAAFAIKKVDQTGVEVFFVVRPRYASSTRGLAATSARAPDMVIAPVSRT